MKKPQIKKEVAVSSYSDDVWIITFYASNDAVQEICEFGEIYYSAHPLYSMFVDRRYDFHEVLEYIKNYGKE